MPKSILKKEVESMSKSLVKANQKKRRISHKERDKLNHLEESQNDKLKWVDIEPPVYLSRKQKNMFKKYAEMLSGINVISALDSDILGHYVYFQSAFEDLVNLVKEEGYISGGKVNPALAEMRQISKTVHTYQTKLGLNPTDRLRFVSKDEEEDDELEMFLNERD